MKRKIITFILFISLISISLFYKDVTKSIIFDFRLPKLIFIIFAGGGLSVCGLILQRIFNNPLATGYTLGVVSASAMMSALYIFMGSFILLPANGIMLSSIIGTIGMILVIKKIFKITISSTAVILSGVALNFFFSSIILFLQSISSFTVSNSILTYITGSLNMYSYPYAITLIFVAASYTAIIIKKTKTINSISLGRAFSVSKGIDYNKEFIFIIIISATFISITTSISGPIAFVDLIVPQIVNRLFNRKFKDKIILNFIFGAQFLILCDIFSRNIISDYIIPISAVTGIIGSIVFIGSVFKKFK